MEASITNTVVDTSLRDIAHSVVDKTAKVRNNGRKAYRSNRLGMKAYKKAFSAQWHSDEILTINDDGSITTIIVTD